MLSFFLKIVLLQSTLSESARILGLSTLPSPSHYIFNRALFVELAKRGHESMRMWQERENNEPTKVLPEGQISNIQFAKSVSLEIENYIQKIGNITPNV